RTGKTGDSADPNPAAVAVTAIECVPVNASAADCATDVTLWPAVQLPDHVSKSESASDRRLPGSGPGDAVTVAYPRPSAALPRFRLKSRSSPWSSCAVPYLSPTIPLKLTWKCTSPPARPPVPDHGRTVAAARFADAATAVPDAMPMPSATPCGMLLPTSAITSDGEWDFRADLIAPTIESASTFIALVTSLSCDRRPFARPCAASWPAWYIGPAAASPSWLADAFSCFCSAL